MAQAESARATIILMDAQGACPDEWRALVVITKESPSRTVLGCWRPSIFVNDDEGGEANLDPSRFHPVPDSSPSVPKKSTQFDPGGHETLHDTSLHKNSFQYNRQL
jgi:hypothetical protein